MDMSEAGQRSFRNRSPSNITEIDQMQLSQKSNQVSSVLLYGIPIVSLYIECQERLCLAQISNTLLKQFSYNEIHNRRVALGITCVQCTPVQLEILRRAGAMPVSSRRCGMITRREAERLCKSFLGDNTPPRLPDDFSFNVQHKCAYGCHGLFLPSRYNSSRAKCIKCTYCGMFFSPNKFIFHSHRLSTNDRYVQPDAANFNSWRRHMILSGQPREEIIHAWEDVKAMFNGGTRKRLVNNITQSSPNSSAKTIISNVSASACNSSSETEDKMHTCEESACAKRSIDQQLNYSTVAAAAAVVGVTAVAAATVGVPFNLHRSTVLSPMQPLRNSSDLSIMPLSRNFVVDYMWQQQQQEQEKHHISQKTSEAVAHGTERCSATIPWVETELNGSSKSNTMPLMHQPLSLKSETNSSMHNVSKNRKLTDFSGASTGSTNDFRDFNLSPVLSVSAFKPVVASAAAIVSTSLYTSLSTNSNTYISSAQSTRTTTVLTHNSRLQPNAIFRSATSSFSPILDSMHSSLDNHELDFGAFESTHVSSSSSSSGSINKNNCSTHLDDPCDTNEDDEVVDIETTEDDTPESVCTNKSVVSEPFSVYPYPCTRPLSLSRSSTHSECQSESPIDIDGFTTDPEDEIKTTICSSSHLDDKGSKTSLDEICHRHTTILETTNQIKYMEDANRLQEQTKRLLRRNFSSNQQRERLNVKREGIIGANVLNNKVLSKAIPPNLHIQQQRVTFPVFLKSQVNSLRHHQHRQPSPSLLTDCSSDWTYPMGNIRQFYCYEGTTANQNNFNLK